MITEPPLRPNMVSVAEAQALVRAAALNPDSERVVLEKGLGRVLTEAVTATRHQPPFDASAMDGYALRRADLTEDRVFAVVGESVAGHGFEGAVADGCSVRIFTGAPVPADCDTVVIQENVETVEGGIRVLPDGLAAKGANIRPAGQDFRAGDTVLNAGVRLDPWRLSLAAAAGYAKVTVARKPVIAILSTGDELVPPGADPRPDQIYESGSHALMALIKQWGGKARYLGVGKDKKKSLLRALRSVKADLIVTIGGASVGDHDLVKPALDKLGLSLHFDGIKVRPGKPTAFGTLSDGRRVLALPGNPASAFVMAQLILKPWIEAGLGLTPQAEPFIQAGLRGTLPANGPREAYLRARLAINSHGRVMVEPFSDQDSSLVSVFARADALIRRPANGAAVEEKALVSVMPLDRL